MDEATQNKQIEISIQKLAGTFNRDIVSIILCSVDSVDETKRTCDCTPIGGDATTQIPSVQLMAEVNDGLLLLPKVGSSVVVGLSTKNNAFVLFYSDLDKIKIITSLTQFNDGGFGGLTKVEVLTQQLNKLEQDINTLKTAFSNWIVIPNDGGAALKTISSVWFGSQLTPTKKTDLENTKVTHG